MVSGKTIFLAGATGYMGRALVPTLVQSGHQVHALVRPESTAKVKAGCIPVLGDALNSETFTAQVPEHCTYVHLVGTPRPAPWKEKQFRAIDLPSVKASVAAAVTAKVSHFIYVSVAHPAPVMKAYVQVRTEAEAIIRTAGLPATILRPWYVIGPSHWWPVVLLPFYKLCERLPATRDASLRLGLLTLSQMVTAILWAVEHPPRNTQILGVPEIKSLHTRDT
jgi:uncharacterized protein YbjT (DUF2867 family)